jgi:hypothetical protein
MNNLAAAFRPLDPAELALAPAVEPVPDWLPIVPVPKGAPRTLPPHRHGKPSAKWAYRDALGNLLFLVCRFDLADGNKDILPLTLCESPEGRHEWRWKGISAPRPLYHLDQLAARPDAPLLVVEGEKAADAAAALFPDHVATTSPNGAKAADKADWSPLAGRVVTIWPDHDEEGASYAADVARLGLAVGAALVAVVAVPDAFPRKWDMADDMPPGWDADGLRGLLMDAPAMGPENQPGEPPLTSEDHLADAPPDDDAEITRLAALPPLAYEREREAVAKRMKVRTAILDKLVNAGRAVTTDTKGQGRALELPSPDLWPTPVDGAALLSEMTATVRRYVVMEEGAAEAVALWVVHAHALEAFTISPRLGITSPEKGCGKTTCLDVVACMVPRPLATANTTPAAIFRTIEKAGPTLLIDEADTFLTDNDEMRGVLNSGHRKSAAFVLRVVGDDHEPRMFSTWAATVIAMIGRLPDTLEDRSIPVRLRRRRADETITPFRADRADDLAILARKAARWAADHVIDLAGVDPAIPPAINNRAADNWRPLLAVADAAGGEWPAHARRIAETVVAGAGTDVQSAKVMLLEDIRAAFEDRGADRLPSADLVAALVDMEGRPWCEWRHGKPVTQNSLARLLAPFSISPGSIRIGTHTAKGYRLEQFTDAFARYIPIPPVQSATPSQPAETQGFQGSHQPSHDHGCYGLGRPANPQKPAICDGVTVEKPLSWEMEI